MAGLTLVPTSLAPSAPTVTSIDAIPEEVRDTVEEAWAYFSAEGTDDDMALTVTLPDKAAKAKFLGLAQAYAASRKTLTGQDALYLRVSPVRANKDTGVATFRIRTMASELARKAETEAIRKAQADARAKVEAAGKGGKK